MKPSKSTAPSNNPAFYIAMAIDQKMPGFAPHYGMGYYLLLIGSIVLVLFSIVGYVSKAAARRA